MHSHDHGHATGNVLKWSLAATFVFVAVEVFAGFQAHSLALISDAGHNFTDGLALLLDALARIEGRIALDEVLTRFPDWDVDLPNAVFSSSSAVRGWDSMPALI